MNHEFQRSMSCCLLRTHHAGNSLIHNSELKKTCYTTYFNG